MKLTLNPCAKCNPTFITISCVSPTTISTYTKLSMIKSCLSKIPILPQHFAHLVCDGLEVPFILQVMTSADPFLKLAPSVWPKETHRKNNSNNLSVCPFSNQLFNCCSYIQHFKHVIQPIVACCFPFFPRSVRLLCVRKGTDSLFGKVMPELHGSDILLALKAHVFEPWLSMDIIDGLQNYYQNQNTCFDMVWYVLDQQHWEVASFLNAYARLPAEWITAGH